MNVSLTPELEKLIRNKVDTGLYHSASEVVREGLRLLEEHDRLRAMRLDDLRASLQVGIDQADAGDVRELDLAAVRRRAKASKARRRKDRT